MIPHRTSANQPRSTPETPLRVAIDFCLAASCPTLLEADLWIGCVVPQWRLDLVRVVVASLAAAGTPATVELRCPAHDAILRAWVQAQGVQSSVQLRIKVEALPSDLTPMPTGKADAVPDRVGDGAPRD